MGRGRWGNIGSVCSLNIPTTWSLRWKLCTRELVGSGCERLFWLSGEIEVILRIAWNSIPSQWYLRVEISSIENISIYPEWEDMVRSSVRVWKSSDTSLVCEVSFDSEVWIVLSVSGKLYIGKYREISTENRCIVW